PTSRNAEELSEDRIVQEWIAILHDFGGIHIHHCRRHVLHNGRVGFRLRSEPPFLRGSARNRDSNQNGGQGRFAPRFESLQMTEIWATRLPKLRHVSG